MIVFLLYFQGFTAGYTMKETNIFVSSDNQRTTEQSRLDPNSSHIMYIGFEYVMSSPRKYF